MGFKYDLLRNQTVYVDHSPAHWTRGVFVQPCTNAAAVEGVLASGVAECIGWVGGHADWAFRETDELTRAKKLGCCSIGCMQFEFGLQISFLLQTTNREDENMDAHVVLVVAGQFLLVFFDLGEQFAAENLGVRSDRGSVVVGVEQQFVAVRSKDVNVEHFVGKSLDVGFGVVKVGREFSELDV